MEISISTWSSLKSTLITYLVLLLAIKVIAFWEILPLALLHTQKWCLMYGQTQNFYYFPHWFGALAVKAMAFSEILLISHQNLPFVSKLPN